MPISGGRGAKCAWGGDWMQWVEDAGGFLGAEVGEIGFFNPFRLTVEAHFHHTWSHTILQVCLVVRVYDKKPTFIFKADTGC